MTLLRRFVLLVRINTTAILTSRTPRLLYLVIELVDIFVSKTGHLLQSVIGSVPFLKSTFQSLRRLSYIVQESRSLFFCLLKKGVNQIPSQLLKLKLHRRRTFCYLPYEVSLLERVDERDEDFNTPKTETQWYNLSRQQVKTSPQSKSFLSCLTLFIHYLQKDLGQ